MKKMQKERRVRKTPIGPAPGSDHWGVIIFAFSILQTHALDCVEMDRNEAAFMLYICSIPFKGEQLLPVGTVAVCFHPLKQSAKPYRSLPHY
jgi:hypothetical protein